MKRAYRVVGVAVLSLMLAAGCKKKDGTPSEEKKEVKKEEPARAPARKEIPARPEPGAKTASALSGALSDSLKGQGGAVAPGQIKGAFSLTGINVPLPDVGRAPQPATQPSPGTPAPSPAAPAPSPTAPAVKQKPATPAPKPVAQPAPGVATYVSPDQKVRFNYPAGWTAGFANNTITVKRNPANDAYGIIEIAVQKVQQAVTAKQLLKVVLTSLRQKLPDLKIIKQMVHPQNPNFILFAATYTTGGQPRAAAGVSLTVKNVAVFGHYSAHPKAFDQANAFNLLGVILKSL